MKHLLSPFYSDWLPPELVKTGLTEASINCDQCRMTPACKGKKAKLTYEPELKCCTYEPFLPNFHLGALLRDPEYGPKFKLTIEERWRSRDVLLPMGMAPNREYQKKFFQKKPEDFGNRADLICSHFDKTKNSCSIWKFRGAVCTSFYCTSEYGALGKKFWKQLGDHLFLLDMSLSEEILADMGFSPRQVSDQLEWLKIENLQDSKLGSISPRARTARLKKLWPPEFQDPFTFYDECYRLALKYKRSSMKQILGDLGKESETKMIQLLQSTRELEKNNFKN